MFGLRTAYNLPLNDTNVQNMSQRDWGHLVKSTLVRHAFLKLKSESAIDTKTHHFEFVLLKPAAYLLDLDHDPQVALVIFVCTRMFDIKVNFRRSTNKMKLVHFAEMAVKIFSMFSLVKMG